VDGTAEAPPVVRVPAQAREPLLVAVQTEPRGQVRQRVAAAAQDEAAVVAAVAQAPVRPPPMRMLTPTAPTTRQQPWASRASAAAPTTAVS
jgi:hypothetical protein